MTGPMLLAVRLLAIAALLAALPIRAQAPAAEPAPAADAARQSLPAMLNAADAAYVRRDAPGALDEIRDWLAEAEKAAPDDYGVLWRQARLYFWLSDDPTISDDQKSKLGKRGWDYAERAIKANPQRVEGYHYAAAGMGNYGLGLGIFAALRQGIEGKFKDRLGAAERLNPDFEHGAIQTAFGRFYFKLPWPKHDAKKSEKYLLAALQKNPENVRAHFYLAELYEDEGEGAAARKQLERAVAGEPGRYDAPEERRWMQVARRKLGK
jgi:tetratricopeptide (TPR) repeat protein